jgi:hypothetical protein
LITILSAIIGFVGGFIPDLLKIFKQKQDNKHELAILQMQMEAMRLGHTQRLEEINVTADIEESKALYESAKIEQTGVKWADAFLAVYNGMVRPSVTYLFVGLYCTVKIAQIYSMVTGSGVGMLNAIKYTYTDMDLSVLLLCLSYYFGARQASKIFGLK